MKLRGWLLAAATTSFAVLSGAAPAMFERFAGIALRTCPPLPATVAERLSDYRARNVADWVMYRKALAGAAAARSPERVLRTSIRVLKAMRRPAASRCDAWTPSVPR